MSGPGQKFQTQRVMVVVVDTQGKAHAWDVDGGVASWNMTGMQGGRSTVRIEIDGPMRRRTRDIDELGNTPGLEGRWELEG